MNKGLFVFLSFHPFRPAVFLELLDYLYSKNVHVVRGHLEICVTEPDFFEKVPIKQKEPKIAKNSTKTGFLNFLAKACY